MLPIDGRAKQIARVIVIIIGVVSLLKYPAIFQADFRQLCLEPYGLESIVRVLPAHKGCRQLRAQSAPARQERVHVRNPFAILQKMRQRHRAQRVGRGLRWRSGNERLPVHVMHSNGHLVSCRWRLAFPAPASLSVTPSQTFIVAGNLAHDRSYPPSTATNGVNVNSGFDAMAFLSTVSGGKTVSHYTKNQMIFVQGDVADAIFYIQRGKVKISVISQEGKAAVVAIQRENEFCGEGCLTGQPFRMAGASALTDCQIMRLDKEAISRALRNEPAFSQLFIRHLLARTMRVEEDLVDQLIYSSEKRLARALLRLANYGNEGKPEPVMAKISHETLADLIGTTRSRVSFFMNKFRRLGFIEYDDKLIVHSSLLNVIVGSQPITAFGAGDHHAWSSAK